VTTGVMDTGGKFAAGDVAPVIPVVHQDLQISPNFSKFQNDPIVIIRGPGGRLFRKKT
jgi:hypothetical protein